MLYLNFQKLYMNKTKYHYSICTVENYFTFSQMQFCFVTTSSNNMLYKNHEVWNMLFRNNPIFIYYPTPKHNPLRCLLNNPPVKGRFAIHNRMLIVAYVPTMLYRMVAQINNAGDGKKQMQPREETEPAGVCSIGLTFAHPWRTRLSTSSYFWILHTFILRLDISKLPAYLLSPQY